MSEDLLMASRFGAFGKMPALGDFFRADLPQGFVDPWDRWLQEGMLSARSTLGEGWQDCYFSAPLWRFTLSPGIAGAAAMTGVMMMSVDRVGRQFPLTLASPLPDGATPLAAHFAGATALAALEEVALDALEDGFTRDHLTARLQDVALPVPPPPFMLTEAQGGLVLTGAQSEGLSAELAARFLDRRFRKPSIWSAELDGVTRLMVCEGLPAGGQMTGLFDMTAQVWHSMEDA